MYAVDAAAAIAEVRGWKCLPRRHASGCRTQVISEELPLDYHSVKKMVLNGLVQLAEAKSPTNWRLALLMTRWSWRSIEKVLTCPD